MSLQTKIVVFTSVLTVVLLVYGALKPPFEGGEVPKEIKLFLSVKREEIDIRKVNLDL